MSGKLQQQQDNGDLKGLKIPRGVNLQTMHNLPMTPFCLGGAFMVIEKRFKRVLSIFLKSSEGKVNASKSKFYGWNWLPGTMARISTILGFEGLTIWNSFSYLGIPIFKGEKKMADWHSVIDKEKNQFLGNKMAQPSMKISPYKSCPFCLSDLCPLNILST